VPPLDRAGSFIAQSIEPSAKDGCSGDETTVRCGFPCTTLCEATPQPNTADPDGWAAFWQQQQQQQQQQRLQPMFSRLADDKKLCQLGSALLRIVSQII